MCIDMRLDMRLDMCLGMCMDVRMVMCKGASEYGRSMLHTLSSGACSSTGST